MYGPDKQPKQSFITRRNPKGSNSGTSSRAITIKNTTLIKNITTCCQSDPVSKHRTAQSKYANDVITPHTCARKPIF